jgi:hypothetical protein
LRFWLCNAALRFSHCHAALRFWLRRPTLIVSLRKDTWKLLFYGPVRFTVKSVERLRFLPPNRVGGNAASTPLAKEHLLRSKSWTRCNKNWRKFFREKNSPLIHGTYLVDWFFWRKWLHSAGFLYLRIRVTRGRCYDHNFRQFCQFSVKKWRFSQKKNNVMITIFSKTSSS